MRTASQQKRMYRYGDIEVGASEGLKAGILQMILLLSLILTLVLAFVWLRSETEQTRKHLVELRSQYSVAAKELKNLKIEKARYSSRQYISNAVEKFELNLQPAFPGQVTKIKAVDNEMLSETSSEGLMAWKNKDNSEL